MCCLFHSQILVLKYKFYVVNFNLTMVVKGSTPTNLTHLYYTSTHYEIYGIAVFRKVFWCLQKLVFQVYFMQKCQF